MFVIGVIGVISCKFGVIGLGIGRITCNCYVFPSFSCGPRIGRSVVIGVIGVISCDLGVIGLGIGRITCD